jgi:hypothetical protein
VGADAVVLAALMPGVLEAETAALRRLARRHPVVLCGPAATAALARRLHARHLPGSPVAAADDLAALVGERAPRTARGGVSRDA